MNNLPELDSFNKWFKPENTRKIRDLIETSQFRAAYYEIYKYAFNKGKELGFEEGKDHVTKDL